MEDTDNLSPETEYRIWAMDFIRRTSVGGIRPSAFIFADELVAYVMETDCDVDRELRMTAVEQYGAEPCSIPPSRFIQGAHTLYRWMNGEISGSEIVAAAEATRNSDLVV